MSNAFELDRSYSVWSRTSSGRGKRAAEVKNGLYIIEHISTGRMIVGVSSHVSKEVDKQLAQLSKGKHENRLFAKLIEMDMDVKLHEVPTKNSKEADKLLDQVVSTTYPDYLNTNYQWDSAKKRTVPIKKSRRGA